MVDGWESRINKHRVKDGKSFLIPRLSLQNILKRKPWNSAMKTGE